MTGASSVVVEEDAQQEEDERHLTNRQQIALDVDDQEEREENEEIWEVIWWAGKGCSKTRSGGCERVESADQDVAVCSLCSKARTT